MVNMDNKGVTLFFFIILANIIFYFIWLKLYTLVAVIIALVAMNFFGIAMFKYYLKKYRPDGHISRKEKMRRNKSIIYTASALMAGLVLLVSLVIWPFSQVTGFYILVIGLALVTVDAVIAYFVLKHWEK